MNVVELKKVLDGLPETMDVLIPRVDNEDSLYDLLRDTGTKRIRVCECEFSEDNGCECKPENVSYNDYLILES